jgi:hypothetical protein
MAAPLSPASVKPPRKAMQPTFIGDLTPQQQQARTLIGGAPTALGTST